MYIIVTKVGISVKPDIMTYVIFNLYHYCTYYVHEKFENGHVFNMYGVVFEHDKV